MMKFIDLKAQYEAIKDDVHKEMNEVFENTSFVMGPKVKECEESLKNYVGSHYAMTCSSGTDALLMALMALDIGAGDEVIVPAFSFFATAEAVSLAGAEPVFVDIEDQTYNIAIDKIAEAITDKTKAIMFVSLYGQMPDVDSLQALAKKHGLALIEDAAQSFGASYKGKKSGSIADISCTSFFPAKPLGCYGDGGALFFNDQKYWQPLEQIRNHGQAGRYEHVRLGINGRMDSLQCAVINAKLKSFDWEVKQRQKIGEAYTSAFSELGEAIRPPFCMEDREHIYGQYTLYVKERESFMNFMKDKGIPTAVHYPSPMYRQKPYAHLGYHLEVSERCSNHVVSLPMHPFMSEEDVQQVIAAVREFK